jgi:arsenate reductase-like glutaredoxin family protein
MNIDKKELDKWLSEVREDLENAVNYQKEKYNSKTYGTHYEKSYKLYIINEYRDKLWEFNNGN